MAELLGCGRTEPARADLESFAPDAGPGVDAGRVDGGRPDAGRPDAGGPVDAGTIDGGSPEPGPWRPKPCLPGTRPLERTVPLIVFVVETSDSMAEPFDTSTKNRTVKSVFEATIPAWDTSSLMGVLTYPTGVCTAFARPETTPARGQVREIVRILEGLGGESPLAEAVTTAGQTLGPLRAANTSRHVILVTDGYPNCNEALSPATCVCDRTPCLPRDCRDDARVVERVRAVAQRSVPTWVLSVDTPDAGVIDLLNDLSVAGGRARQWTPRRVHAHAGDGQELASHLREVGDRIRRCSRITRSVPANDRNFVVSFEGAPNDVANGWAGSIARTASSCCRGRRVKPCSVALPVGSKRASTARRRAVSLVATPGADRQRHPVRRRRPWAARCAGGARRRAA
ncbi:MAG: vWA domain-containing protein [Myxococcaceae bacterium]|nr:vWA domain-containing protein [Myxococcaceae bacterium]